MRNISAPFQQKDNSTRDVSSLLGISVAQTENQKEKNDGPPDFIDYTNAKFTQLEIGKDLLFEMVTLS